MKLSKTKHFVYVTMLAAMAIAINLLETMLTVSLPFGMRLGLANIIALITIEILGVKEMIIVNTMRVVIGNSCEERSSARRSGSLPAALSSARSC